MDLLSAMQTFVRVSATGSLSRAARAMKVTPAAVSRQITALEAELGATLLVRTTRRIQLTEEGRRFYEHAERTVGAADEARASVRGDSSITGRVAVSAPTAVGLTGLDVALAELVAANPALAIDLRLEDHPVDLLADGIDVAIRAGLTPPDSTTLVAVRLARTTRVVVAAPSYLRRRGEPRTVAQLAAHAALIHLHAGAGVGVWRLHHGDRSQDVPVTGPLRGTALQVLRDAAVHGAGIALLPQFLVAADLRARRLRALVLGGWQPSRQDVYALVRVESKHRARVRAVLDHTARYFHALDAVEALRFAT